MVAILDAAMDGPVTPLAFTTAAVDEIRIELHRSRCPIIDFFDLHMAQVESILQARGERVASQLHGVGDIKRYNSRMQAVEYAIEHDDGQSVRALDKADVILVAPSRCGKTPTTMYLALQHGIFVANYPLVEEDLERTTSCPAGPGTCATGATASSPHPPGCVRCGRSAGRTPAMPRSSSAPWSCAGRGDVQAAHSLPIINSSAKSVEEMSTVILQSLATKA